MKNLHKMGCFASGFSVTEKRKRKVSTTTGELLPAHCHSAFGLAGHHIHFERLSFPAFLFKFFFHPT